MPAGDGCLVLHFGMTGGLSWTTSGREPEDYDRVCFDLEGGQLRYHARRKLGDVCWVPAGGDVQFSQILLFMRDGTSGEADSGSIGRGRAAVVVPVGWAGPPSV